jgi:hypothetical protein
MRSVRTALRSVALAVVVACALPLPAAEAAGGDILWEDTVESSTSEIALRSVSLVHAGAVFVAGTTDLSDGVGLVVRAYALSNGQFLWEDRRATTGHWVMPAAIAAEGNTVVVVGAVVRFSFPSTSRWYVYAYDRRTGRGIWQDDLFDAHAADAVVRNGRLFVTGSVTRGAPSQPGRTDLTVRVYDVDGGALLWQDRYGVAGHTHSGGTIRTDGFRVFVLGRSRDLGTSDFMGLPIIRAYDVRTGVLVWSDRLTSIAGETVYLNVMSVAGSRLVVAGGRFDVSHLPMWSHLLMRAYDVATGEVQWETERDIPGMLWGNPTAMAAQPGRVFLAGIVNPENPFEHTDWLNANDIFVGAYDAMTGRPIWEDRVDVGNADEAWAVAALGNRVFVTGAVGHASGDEFLSDGDLHTDFFVRSYDAQSGAIAWTDRYNAGPREEGGPYDGGYTITAATDRVVAAGTAGRRFFVRAYEGR